MTHDQSASGSSLSGIANAGVCPIERAGMAELTKDHLCQRPATDRDWNSLTFGEQHEYETRACRTAGAIYKSKVGAEKIEMAVELPASLALRGLTEDEAASIERYLHRQVESAIVWIIKSRQQQGRQS